MTREEAIEVYNGLINTKIKEAFEFFAPELRESENERIRKGLIEVLKASKTVGELKFILPEPTREEAIVYLEKQKEQNSVPSRETILGIWELGNFWKENPEERGGLTQLQYIQKYWTEKCDYQKEQKPAQEKLSYEEIVRNAEEEVNVLYPNNEEEGTEAWERRECLREHYMKGAVQAAMESLGIKEQKPVPKFKVGDLVKDVNHHACPVYKIIGTDDECYICKSDDATLGDRAVMHFTFDNPYLRLVNPKPAEWNANDKAFIKDCAHILDENGYAASAERLLSMFPVRPAEWNDTNELVFKDICKHLKEEGYNGWIVLLNALRNGEFQPKQEWSGVDDLRLHQTIDVCDRNGYPVLSRWLKGLPRRVTPQSSWKPSEEQMKEMRKSITYWQGITNEIPLSKLLESLYDDLKKLM